MSLKTKRIQSIFIPFSNQTGLIFGHGSWQNINPQLHSSGCMIYQARTSTSVFNTYSPSAPDSRGFMTVDDVGLTSMLPKMVMIFSWSDTGTNSASFIGFKKDADLVCTDVTDPFPDGLNIIGIGYRTSDTNIQVIRNDGTGSSNYTDTAIPRSTNVFKIEIEFESTTSVRVSLYDIDVVLIYEGTFTTELPSTGIDMGFTAHIQNANASIRYVINMFDFIRLEKTKAPLSATTDF